MGKPAINIQKLNYTYSSGTAFAYQALYNINLEIMDNEITAIVGQTGSGKSTLMQLVDGLLVPTSGEIYVNGVTVTAQSNKADFTKLRRQIGFVFQFPESQLFADTVLQDVMFGPSNLGMSPDQARKQVIDALQLLNFPSDMFDQSPFQLSGGQMRRVAIAGVLAMKPKILILDEPTAGLDPKGQYELMRLIKQLHEQGTTIIFITHQMEQVVQYADRVVALQNGKIGFDGTPRQLFDNQDLVNEIGLAEPYTLSFARQLEKQGLSLGTPLTITELADQIVSIKREKDD